MFLRRVARKCRSITRYYRNGGEGFAVVSPLYIPAQKGALGRAASRALALQLRTVLRLAGMRKPLVWVACPTAACILDRIPRAAIVYQLSDYYSALDGGPGQIAADFERTIAHHADLIVCSSTLLTERARRLFGRGEYVDHGVDFAMFDSAVQTQRVPVELRGLRKPIVGFFGNLDRNTVDRELLEQVVRIRPDYTFVLLGPMTEEFQTLRLRSNLVTVSQRPYSEIPHYGVAFDVCLMPWVQNEWIRHCNPVKLKEYLALGKPVVSTPFPELQQYNGLCYQASGSAAFASAIDRALAEDSPSLFDRRRSCAAQHTWDDKYAKVVTLLEQRGLRRNE